MEVSVAIKEPKDIWRPSRPSMCCLEVFLELPAGSLALFTYRNNVKKKQPVFIQTYGGLIFSFQSNVVLFSLSQSMKKKT